MGLRNRHWKQQYSKDAKFVWLKSVTWKGEQVVIGEPIPDDLTSDRNKTKRFWDAGVIELSDFIKPDVTTGQVAEVEAEEAETEVEVEEEVAEVEELATEAPESPQYWRSLAYADQVALARENGLEGRGMPSKVNLEAFLTEKLG